MKSFFAIVLLCLPFLGSTAEPTLATNGKARVVIVHPASPHATELRAACELARYLQQVTGVPFEVLAENELATGQRAIYVGQSVFAQAHGVDFALFHPEEWLIQTTPEGDLILAGGKYAGIIYAVYDYLERQCGIHWLDETCEVVPTNPDLTIGSWNLRRKPSMAVRQVFDMLDWSPSAGAFKERNKGFSYTQNETGVAKYYGGNRPYHTAGEYAADWPRDRAELYARDAQGNPMPPTPDGGGGGQICMTNPEARQRVLDKMRAYIERDRRLAAEQQIAPPFFYDFSGNDNLNKCTCPDCMELARREGSYSGATLDFVNWVARHLREEYPEILVKTFAYLYCEDAPEHLLAEPNVMVHIAVMGVEGGGSYRDYDTMRSLAHPVNQSALRKFRKWGAHASHLMHWQYWTLYPVIPEPTVHVRALCQDIAVDRECNIEAFFAEYENPAFNSFSTLTRWLAYKLTADADADPQELIRIFMEGYYGNAAPQMTELLEYMEDCQERFEYPIGYLELAFRSYLDDEYFATTLGLLRSAEAAAAEQPEVVTRIRRELPCLLAGLMARWPYLKDHSSYQPEQIAETFRTEAYQSMDYFFREDQNNFRVSEGFDRKVETACLNFRAAVQETAGPMPAGVTLGAPGTYLSLSAASFLYEAQGKLVDDPEAFVGKTCQYEYGEETLNLYLNNWMDGGTPLQFELTEERLPKDGKYHWIDLGTTTFINNGRYHLLIPKNMQGIRCEFYRKMPPNSIFHVYVSLKCDRRTICCDRVLLVRPSGE